MGFKSVPRGMNPAGIAIAILLAQVFSIWSLTSCNSHAPSKYKPSYKGARLLDKRLIEFDDGDTFLFKGKPLRILGMDCPEVKNPNVGIYEDQPFGLEAAESTKSLITRARVAEYLPDGRDAYGRLLAHVFVDGELLSVKLIRMGLAYETVTTFGDSGFPDLARRIFDASLTSPKPRFQKPYLWRKKHQQRRRYRR